MPRAGILINARLQSTRLPKKHLKLVNNKPIFLYLVDRIMGEFINEISKHELAVIIATSDIQENREFENFKKYGLEIFYGSISNIPLRHKQAAERYKLGIIISVDGDDIFTSLEGMRMVYKMLLEGSNYVKTNNLPFGMNVFGYTRDFLISNLTGKEPVSLEMGWTRQFDNKYLQTVSTGFDFTAFVPNELLRFTLDYQEDFDFFQKVIEFIGEKIYKLSDHEIVDYVFKNKLYTINESISKIYWKNFNRLVESEINLE